MEAKNKKAATITTKYALRNVLNGTCYAKACALWEGGREGYGWGQLSPFVFAQAWSISGIKKFVNLFLAVKLMINTNTQTNTRTTHTNTHTHTNRDCCKTKP